MGQNQIGAVSVPALKSALPRSADFTFIDDGHDKWGLGFLITANQIPGETLARQPGAGAVHQQHVLLLDRSCPRHRGVSHDADIRRSPTPRRHWRSTTRSSAVRISL